MEIVSILTFPQQVGGCGYPTVYTRSTGVLRARGACVFNFRRNDGIGGCATRDRGAKWNAGGRGGEKKTGRKGKVRKRGNLHNRFRARRIHPPQQFPGHRLFVYMGSSISIYNMPSLHAAAAAAGRKSHRAEKWFLLGNVACLLRTQ